jgi:4-hydroxy-tetrahydrodipicolinate reductase
MSTIALLGYGKMGKRIETLAHERNHRVVLCTNETPERLPSDTEVIINFSTPDSAVDLIRLGLQQGIPVVSGTTGWLERLSEVEALATAQQTAFLYSSNFSLGVNLFFALNDKLATLMAPHNAYKVSMTEIHHTQKLDAPSGTALSLATPHLKAQDLKGISEVPKDDHLQITSLREGEVPGTHVVNYQSTIDEISIRHEAFSRDGFALGALLAAEWIIGKKGIFTMSDVINLHP